MQSRARRSYKAVVMPTDALLTLGMLKLASLILAVPRRRNEVGTRKGEGVWGTRGEAVGLLRSRVSCRQLEGGCDDRLFPCLWLKKKKG